MSNYLQENSDYWQKGYDAENVESYVFRPYGRVFKAELGIDGSKNEKLLDFGCGSGATARFFHSKGFNVFGVDISRVDIERCHKRMPTIADHFAVIDPAPKGEAVFFGGEFDVVTAIQSLYYFTNTDFQTCLKCLHRQMKKGAIIYATMIGSQSWYYDHSTPEADGLRCVNIHSKRFNLENYHVNFTASTEEIISKFSIFKKIHVGYYDGIYSEHEGSDIHYTFIGRKE